MAADRAGIVAEEVTAHAHEPVGVRAPFEAGPAGHDVLVVVVLAGGQIGAEAIAVEAGHGGAEREVLGQRRFAADHQVGLGEAADAAADAQARLVAEAPGHVLDRTADGVAPVQRALRASEHLDPLDVEDIQHRALRPVQEHVIDVDADAGLEAGHRILLADAADERGQGVGGAARDLQSGVGNDLLEEGDVLRADILQRFAGQRGDGDGHVELGFLAAAGGDADDVHDLPGLGALGSLLLGGGGLGHGGTGQGQRNGQAQRGTIHSLHKSVPFGLVMGRA